MTRTQRAAHRWIFWILGPLLIAAVAHAIFGTSEAPPQDPPPGLDREHAP